jgi:hypothetical protein
MVFRLFQRIRLLRELHAGSTVENMEIKGREYIRSTALFAAPRLPCPAWESLIYILVVKSKHDP